MQFNFPAPPEKQVPLSSVSVGSIVRFTDSANGAQNYAQAQMEPGQNLHLVFSCSGKEEGEKTTEGYTNLMSLDGEYVWRRQNDRLVVVHEVAEYLWEGGVHKSTGSIAVGSVILRGVSEEDFVKMKPKNRREFLFIKMKETPAVVGRVSFASFLGKKIFLDDDRVFPAVEPTAKGFALNFK